MTSKPTVRTIELACVGALLVLAGCGNSTPSGPDTRVATVVVSPSAATLVSIGEARAFTASARTASGGAASAGAFAWSVDDASIARVAQDGTVTALANGSTTLRATTEGITGSAQLVVAQEPASLEAVSGDVQYGVVALPLDSVVVVRALDALGTPVPAAELSFAVADDGAVGDATVGTDAQGVASTSWTLGTVAGIQELRVSSVDAPAVTATITATAAAGEPDALVLLDGDGQTELPEHVLPRALAVQVLDAFGNGVADVAVGFTALDGSLADDSVSTDLDGVASTAWTLGPALGAHTATAAVDSIATGVEFSATAVGFSLQPLGVAALVAGDTLSVQGTGFAPAPQNNTVRVGDVLASIVGGDQTSIHFVVPDFGCVPERGLALSVEREAEAAAENTTWRPADVLELALGERRVLDDPGAFCLQFLGDESGNDEYLVGITAAAELDAELSLAILAHDGVTEPILPVPTRVSPRPRVGDGLLDTEARLRDWERRSFTAATPLPTVSAPAAAPPTEGDPLTARVPLIAADVCSDFTTVGLTVRAVGTHFAIATDDANPTTDELDPSELAAVVAMADGTVFDLASDRLGAATDMDGNGRLLIVVTQEVNRQDVGLGFTTAADFFPAAECSSSDEGEVVYVAAPDPLGTVGPGLSKADLLARLPMQLAHEVAHALHFGRRIADGLALPDGWLAEGQAQLVREAVAFATLGDQAGSDYDGTRIDASPEATLWYGPQFEALSRFFGWDGGVAREDDAPDRCSIYAFEGASTACTGPFASGAAWSFARYLSDRFGGADPSALQRALATDGRDAREALEAATGSTFDALLVAWAAALYVDGRLPDGAAPELALDSWNLAGVFDARPAEQRLTPPEFGFTSFGVGRSLLGGATTYLRVSEPGPRGPLAIRVRNAVDGVLGTALEPRLWVVRIR